MNIFIIFSTVIISILGLYLSIKTFLETNRNAIKKGNSEIVLSEKLDVLLREACMDEQLLESLGSSIKDFEDTAKGIISKVDVMKSTNKYSDEMVKAAAQMESLNNLYKVQIVEDVEENKRVLKEKMEELSKNLSMINGLLKSSKTNKV